MNKSQKDQNHDQNQNRNKSEHECEINNQEQSQAQEWKPGEIAPETAEYKCSGCGHEIHVSEHGRFPPENHHQHSPDHGAIRWHLIKGGKSDEKSTSKSASASASKTESESQRKSA